MAGAFQPHVLIPAIRVCRSCGQPERRPRAPAAPPTGAPAVSQGVLFTIGYAGMRLEPFLRAMRERQIEVLLDTRWSAWSEYPGFGQDTLRRALVGRGIAYRHLPALGSRPSLRHQLKEDGDWPAFVAASEAALAGQHELLGRVAAYAKTHRVCLLCMEHTADHCHRSVRASRLADLAGLTIDHLMRGEEMMMPMQTQLQVCANPGCWPTLYCFITSTTSEVLAIVS